jgi:hypothetical protein
MRCPEDIREALTWLLAYGLLRIRSFGWAGRADLCAHEADHIHNLPELIRDYSPDRLTYYWEAERPAYMARYTREELRVWDDLWSQLEPLIPRSDLAERSG